MTEQGDAQVPPVQVRCGTCGQVFWGGEALGAHRPGGTGPCAPGDAAGMRHVDHAWQLLAPPAG